MKPTRHQIAAGVTVVALGALATVALASGSTPATDTAAAPQSAPEVRTEIVRETVHRRAKASSSPSSGSRAVRSSSSPSAGRSTAAVAPVAGPSHQRRGRGTDDVGFTQPTSSARTGDDHGGDDDSGHHGGRGRDDDGSDDHGGRGRGGDRR